MNERKIRSTLDPVREGWGIRDEVEMQERMPLDKIRIAKDDWLNDASDSKWMVDGVWIRGDDLYISEAVDYYQTFADAVAHIPSFLTDNGYTIDPKEDQ